MTEVIVQPVRKATDAAKRLRVTFQTRKHDANEQPGASSDSLAWEKFVVIFQKPRWHGIKPLTTYVHEYDDLLLFENIPAPHWRPVSFPHGSTDITSVRSYAIVFDVDGMSIDEIKAHMRGTKGLAHTTYRHTPSSPRWRVILPLQTSISRKDWQIIFADFQRRFSNTLCDTNNPEPWHWYRLPSCPTDAVDFYAFEELEGQILDGPWTAARVRVDNEHRKKHAQKQASAAANHVAPIVAPEEHKSAIAVEALSEISHVHTECALGQPAQPACAVSDNPADNPATSSPTPHISASHASSPKIGLPTGSSVSNDHVDLMARLESLVDSIRDPDDYTPINGDYLDTCYRLNEFGLWAPAFRPHFSIPAKKAERRSVHATMLQDRIVLDCHWLHSNKHQVFPREDRWKPLFNLHKSFDIELAEEFASRVIKSEYRAEAILGLTLRQQVQLRAIRGTVADLAFNELKKSSSTTDGKRIPSRLEVITLTVNRWAEKDPRVAKHRDKYIAHAKARELLKSSSPTRKEIAELAGLIRGVPPLSERSVFDTLDKLDKRLGK